MLYLMDFTWADLALWIVAFAAQMVLFFVMLRKQRAKQFPFFTIFIGFNIMNDAALYFVRNNAHVYELLYYSGQSVNFILQLFVVVEIAGQVFRPFGRWATGARSFWIAACALSLVAALGLTFVASPHAPSSLWAWAIKGVLFGMMFTCMISIAVLVTARRYGLGWRNHVMGLAQGWTFWAFITFVVETCHSYFGFSMWYFSLDHVGTVAGIAALIYWIFIFWQEEPIRVATPEGHKILIEQQRQLDYYLAKLVSRPGTRRSP